ncbi:DUF7549 family protein [Halohasta salina]|uniref:DUF7549 family protein n=1 Tax=Halohasta salina TaxID=2961621 RepID=UPI0020A447F1|nr:hypothetical protein [Halohasta salina]
MGWIRRDRAGHLAVIVAGLAAVLPWNVTYTATDRATVLFVRFPFFEFQYTQGFGPGVDGPALRSVIGAIGLQSGQGLEAATLVWGGGAVVVFAALLAAGVAYGREPSDGDTPHPIRRVGWLLAAAALLFAVSTGYIWTGGFGGVPIPVGVVLLGAFAWVLVTADLTDPD